MCWRAGYLHQGSGRRQIRASVGTLLFLTVALSGCSLPVASGLWAARAEYAKPVAQIEKDAMAQQTFPIRVRGEVVSHGLQDQSFDYVQSQNPSVTWGSFTDMGARVEFISLSPGNRLFVRGQKWIRLWFSDRLAEETGSRWLEVRSGLDARYPSFSAYDDLDARWGWWRGFPIFDAHMSKKLVLNGGEMDIQLTAGQDVTYVNGPEPHLIRSVSQGTPRDHVRLDYEPYFGPVGHAPATRSVYQPPEPKPPVPPTPPTCRRRPTPNPYPQLTPPPVKSPPPFPAPPPPPLLPGQVTPFPTPTPGPTEPPRTPPVETPPPPPTPLLPICPQPSS